MPDPTPQENVRLTSSSYAQDIYDPQAATQYFTLSHPYYQLKYWGSGALWAPGPDNVQLNLPEFIAPTMTAIPDLPETDDLQNHLPAISVPTPASARVSAISMDQDHESNHSLHEHRCSQCGMHFSTKSNLNRHERARGTHKSPARSKIKNRILHKCSQCNRAYFRKRYLERHEKTHEREKPKCFPCNRTFYNNTNLRRHEKTHNK